MVKTDLLGSLEQKIMDILWTAKTPQKPAQVLKKLKGKYAYTTIMTVLKRMNDKCVLERKLIGKVYFYSPLANKEKFIKSNLSGIFDELVGSYGHLAISQFVDSIKNNKDDLKLLQKYLSQNK
ncbi:MAG: BlaI/MecI/CopY family transcriptional regulator [Candidatus Shapirobacteria bacterium]|nr:BlaI/MecI/CopY family transcriptional regulator [Candidatus Shapirobacteria bacterium]